MPQTQKPRARRTLAVAILGITFLLGEGATGAFASEPVPFEELGGDQCFMFSLLVGERTNGNRAESLHLIIDDKIAFRKLFDPKILRQSCAHVDMSKVITNVDFYRKTVLGFWNSGNCGDTFERTVTRNDRRKILTYTITTVPGPLAVCMRPGPEGLNLIAIPKLPDGYEVVFTKIGGTTP
jgi:hypothetical protein